MTTEEQDLSQANAIAHIYPYTVQGAGGATINGKTYLWDYDKQTMVLMPQRTRKKK